MQALSHDQIQVRAYELWEQEGKPYGRSEEFWLRATAELGVLTAVKKPKKTAAKSEAVAPVKKKAAAVAPKAKTVTEAAAKPKKKAAPKKGS